VGGILLEGFDGHDEQAERAAAATVFQVVEDLGLSWAEGYGIYDGVGAAERGDDLGRFGDAAVVAGFADEQDGVAIVVFAGVEEFGRVFDGIERGCVGAVAGSKLAERAAGGFGIA
jgi:hypothetical protein